MQIRPMRSDLKAAGFGGDQGVFVGLRRSPASAPHPTHQIIFEHTFNIYDLTPTLLRH
jgi:hypothetical protein